ncbi:MAG: EpsI family protein [Gammaproteobacteria bacterium]|nr:EpsI family protein [Gammaproteobacteria bacterium]
MNEAVAQPNQIKTSLSSEWKRAAVITSVTILGILLLFSGTVRAMIISWRTEPYSYGALIFPIAIWLVWSKRQQLASLTPRAEFRVLPLMLVAGALWLQAYLVSFQFFQQIALISLVVMTIWCVLGTRVAKALAFPLALLLFAAPPLFAIEPLYPLMQEFTTDFVTLLLRLTEIPVFREGYDLTLSNSRWAIDEQCSGVQYLTSSVIVGCVYAYYFFRSAFRRLLVVALAIFIPIIANLLRAYVIILIGYFSDMKLAVGIDHIVYGWIFYFIVIYLMFVIGSYWRESDIQTADAGTPDTNNSRSQHRSAKIIGAGLASILIASIWPAIAVTFGQSGQSHNYFTLIAPKGVDGWLRVYNRQWGWSPQVNRSDGEFNAFYHRDKQVVSLYVAQFSGDRQQIEPFGRPNVRIVPEAQSWRNDIRRPKEVTIDGGPQQVLHANTVTIIAGEGWGDLRVWYWYRIGDSFVTSPFKAKLLDAWALLTGSERVITLIAMATRYQGDEEASERVLKSFAASMVASVEAMLDRSTVKAK